MLWAKLYTDILGDPKLMRAARKGSRQLELLPWLIVFAKQCDDGGRLSVNGEPAEPEDIAALLPGVRASRVSDAFASLLACGVLTTDPDGVLRLTAWDARSGRKPSDSPAAIGERVKRHRQQKRNAESETPCNALPVTPCNATEQEQEQEREEEKRERKRLPRAAAPGVSVDPATAPGAFRVAQLVEPPPVPVPVLTRAGRPGRPGKAAKPPKAPALYPHYPQATCRALHAVWELKRGAIDYGRFRKETAGLFTTTPPRYESDELEGALRACFAVLEHRAQTQRQHFDWSALTPERWAGRIVEWVAAHRVKCEDGHLFAAMLDAGRFQPMAAHV